MNEFNFEMKGFPKRIISYRCAPPYIHTRYRIIEEILLIVSTTAVKFVLSKNEFVEFHC